MKFSEAIRIICDSTEKGYRVSFEWLKCNILTHDYFPDRNEPLLKTEQEALNLARLFAEKTVGKCVNIQVVDQDFKPCKKVSSNYEQKHYS